MSSYRYRDADRVGAYSESATTYRFRSLSSYRSASETEQDIGFCGSCVDHYYYDRVTDNLKLSLGDVFNLCVIGGERNSRVTSRYHHYHLSSRSAENASCECTRERSQGYRDTRKY